jgi:hypothetical protein
MKVHIRKSIETESSGCLGLGERERERDDKIRAKGTGFF